MSMTRATGAVGDVGAAFHERRSLHPDRQRYARRLHGAGEVVAVAAEAGKQPPPVEVAPEEIKAPNGRVALLCCGPSLKETWRDDMFESFAQVVAVNDAAFLFRCHWVVGSDRHILEPIIERKHPCPLRGAITNNGWGRRFRDAGMAHILPDTFRDKGPLGKQHTSYSMVAAVHECLKMAGPGGRVDIHGFDASPSPSITGIDRMASHKAARWKMEAGFLRRIWDRRRIVCHGKAPKWLLDYVGGLSDKWGP